MELSQKELPLEKRFDLIVSHNKFLMGRNALLQQELASQATLKAEYDELKWKFERFKEENKKPPIKMGKKHKVAIEILKQRGLYQEYLNKTRG